jgi:hypothetical protein
MGWADTARKPGRTGLKWSDADLNTAAAVCAAQLPVVAALSWLGTLNDDDPYGAGYDSAFGLACLLLFAPLLLWVLGWLHAAVDTMPAATLARLTVRRAGGREWVWHLVFVGGLGVVWSAVGAAFGGTTPRTAPGRGTAWSSPSPAAGTPPSGPSAAARTSPSSTSCSAIPARGICAG